MRLWLVRHGQVQVRAREFYGGTEVPLSEDGMEQARQAAAALAKIDFKAVISSPLERALFGAGVIAEPRGAEVIVDEGWREIDRGHWVGMTPEEVEAKYPGELSCGREDPEGWRGNGGESVGDLRARVLCARDRLLERHAACDVVVVAHSRPILAVLAEAARLDFHEWTQHRVPTGSISRVDYSDEGAEIRFVGWRPDEGAAPPVGAP